MTFETKVEYSFVLFYILLDIHAVLSGLQHLKFSKHKSILNVSIYFILRLGDKMMTLN